MLYAHNMMSLLSGCSLVFIDRREILSRVNKALSLQVAAIIRVCEIMEMLIKGPLVLTTVFPVSSQSPQQHTFPGF